MKKILLLAAAAVVAMTSCSKDQATQGNNQGDPISFKSRGTKATATTNDNLREFMVYAYWDENGTTVDYTTNFWDYPNTNWDDENPGYWDDKNPGYMFKTEVTGSYSGNWTYSPLKYWPIRGNLHFFAYSPMQDLSINNIPTSSAKVFSSVGTPVEDPVTAGTTGKPIVYYTVGTEVPQQEDFIVANALNQVKGIGPVELTFGHALSQIVFQARVLEEAQSVAFTISSIEIVNVRNTGTYDLTNDLTANVYDPQTLSGWSDVKTINGGQPLIYEALTGPQVVTYGSTGEFLDLMASDEILMLIPQTLIAGSDDSPGTPADLAEDGGESYLIIRYDAVDIESGAPVLDDAFKTKVIGLGADWKRGKRYVYRLSFSADVLEPIIFNVANVEEWEDDDQAVNPSNPADYNIYNN